MAICGCGILLVSVGLPRQCGSRLTIKRAVEATQGSLSRRLTRACSDGNVRAEVEMHKGFLWSLFASHLLTPYHSQSQGASTDAIQCPDQMGVGVPQSYMAKGKDTERVKMWGDLATYHQKTRRRME